MKKSVLFFVLLLVATTTSLYGMTTESNAENADKKYPFFVEVPDDIVIPSAPIKAADWTNRAVIVQPWGESSWDILAMENVDGFPDKLRKIGINTIIINPEKSHNVFVDQTPQFTLTEQEILDALQKFRAAGFRVLLYSSITNLGHSPYWQYGELQKEHPDWLQVDSQGNHYYLFGERTLDPNTGAFDEAVRYTKELIDIYQPDAVMFDNSMLARTTTGLLTSYAQGSQEAFREYVRERFGNRCAEFFGVNLEEVSIPTGPGPMYNLWLHWRNWNYAERLEAFRTDLAPTMFFANTPYLYYDICLACDMQLRHEDVTLSETNHISPLDATTKLLYGKALGGKRPLWNYMGTFDSKGDQFVLRTPFEVKRQIASTLAMLGNPWLVYYGFEGTDEQTKESKKVVEDMLFFRYENEQFYNNIQPVADLTVLVSTRYKEFIGGWPLPALVNDLVASKIATNIVVDTFMQEDIDEFAKVIVAENTWFLSEPEIEFLVKLIEDGATLITTEKLGLFDAIGRERPFSLIARKLGMSRLESGKFGKGAIVLVEDSATIVAEAIKYAPSAEIDGLTTNPALQLWQYQTENGEKQIIHILNGSEAIRDSDWTLSIPWDLQRTDSNQSVVATIFRPEMEPITVDCQIISDGIKISMPEIDAYAVICVTTL